MRGGLAQTLAIVAAVALLLVAFFGLIPTHWISLLNYAGMASFVALGLVVLTGVGGMTSFGQAAFVGMSAYSSAVLTLYYGVSPWVALPIALIITMFGALIVGIISVNLSGHFLPLSTLAWGIAFFYLLGNVVWLGAYEGLRGIPPLQVAGHPLIEARHYFAVVWLGLVIVLFATRNLLRGRLGRAIRALGVGR